MATRALLPGAECALFPADATLPDAPDFAAALNGRFTPGWPQAVEAEQLLAGALLQPLTAAQPTRYFIRRQAIAQLHLSAYRRQYFGFYNDRHQPCLFINFFYSNYYGLADAGWLHSYVSADDGGLAFWRIYYNLATHRFYSFSPNPEG